MTVPGTGTMVWVDAETTGLDVDHDAMLELAVIITDDRLNELARLSSIIRPPHDLLQRLQKRPPVLRMHTASGLLQELMTANLATVPTVAELEHLILTLIDQHVDPSTTLCMAGSGVANFDRHLIEAQMPALACRLTYWSIDSGCERRHFEKATGEHLVPADATAVAAHRALADVENALEAGRLAQAAYRSFAAMRHGVNVASTAEERVLIALGLIGSFTGGSIDGPERFIDLYALQGDAEHIGGLADAGSMLLAEAAAATGVDRSALLDRVRARVLVGASDGT